MPMFEKLKLISEKFAELETKMASPEYYNEPAVYKKLAREQKELAPLVEAFREYERVEASVRDAEALLKTESDADFREMAREEIEAGKLRLAELAERLKLLLLPGDPDDNKNVIMEIRGGAGGQHVNKTESAIRITLLPTGLVGECQDERSQHKNRDRALSILRSKLYEREMERQTAAIAAERKSQVGTGMRHERIRTYNYPQSRVTDHRIGLTLYKLDAVLDGDLDELIDALRTADQAERLQASSEKR